MAGLNYFLTDEARGGTSKKLLGEKRDVKVWLSWLDRMAHRDVAVIDTPIGYLPKYEDSKVCSKRLSTKTIRKSSTSNSFHFTATIFWHASNCR